MGCKLLLSVAGVIALASVNPASAAVVNWTFDSYDTGLTNSSTGNDGAFSSTISANRGNAFTFGDYLSSVDGNSGAFLKLTFNKAITALSFDVGSLDLISNEKLVFAVTPTLSAASGVDWTPVEMAAISGMTVTHDGNNNASGRVSFTGLGDITSFTFTETFGSGHVVYYDNFTATVVPVPAAVWLFGAGLVGLVGVARRK